jgi:hypothetical protein
MPAGAAVVAACCVAASPVLLVQMMQPMSDVPATAWWVAAAAALTVDSPAAAVTAGLAASLAIMTRPNLVPLALPIVAFLFVGETAGRRVVRRAFWFAAGCVPGVALVAATNAIFYGSPLTSGYGSLGAIYHGGGAATTIATYLRWLWDTHSVLVVLPLVAVVYRILGGRCVTRETAAFCGAALGVMAVNIGCYAFYERYDHWTYLRFLLPGLPLLIVGGIGAVSDVCAGATLRSRAMVLGFIALMFPFAFIHTAARADAFRLKPEFRHTYQDAAAFADAHLPSDAAFIAVGQSGSLRLYGNRLTLRLDTLAPPDADPFVSYLERQHYAPYAALNRDEVSLFLTRYAGTGVGRAAMLRTHVALPPDGAVVFFPLGGTAK